MNKNREFREVGEFMRSVSLQTGAEKRKALGSSPVLGCGLGRFTWEPMFKFMKREKNDLTSPELEFAGHAPRFRTRDLR
jgi:hypothetical protein